MSTRPLPHPTRTHRTRRAALAVLLGPLLLLGLLPAAAQAAPRTPDPERVVVPRAAAPAPQRQAPPASIDSDVYAYAASPTGRIYFAVAGHLRLALKGSSTTRYAGTFVDHVGGKATKASADASVAAAPTLTIKAKNGTFTFRGDSYFGGSFYSGTATAVPSKLGVKAAKVTFAASSHVVKSSTYQVVLTERSGAPNRPFEYSGSLTLVYDANGRVSGGQVTVTDRKGRNVTHALKNSGYASSAYFYTVAQVDKTFMGLTASSTGTVFSGFAFGGSGSKTTQWILTATP